MSNTTRRGRPLTFTPEQRAHFAELIKIHGARKTKEISLVPISNQTLLKIAREFDIPLKRGRRRRAA